MVKFSFGGPVVRIYASRRYVDRDVLVGYMLTGDTLVRLHAITRP